MAEKTGDELLIRWLNDAYAMERSLEEVLKRHATDAAGAPDVQDRIMDHLTETRNHARTVSDCIESLGGSVSKAKSALSSVTGMAQGMLNRPASDTMVKNALADYAAEQFEIASYQALIHAATELGHSDIVGRLEPVLAQEQAMAQFLMEALPAAVSDRLKA
jgi:ferritin-like metal-binding protein YciE